MKILVLGGTGAIGTYLIEQLALTTHTVYVTSRQKRASIYSNVIYLLGNAHDTTFLSSISTTKYDVLVDFMNYTAKEFTQQISLLLKMTDQYIFLSSARVYADANRPLQESDVRLYDTELRNNLAPNSYPLAKAMQENLLLQAPANNWTIIRPYITYSPERLQLGAYEKEHWLYRILNGHTVWIPNELANRQTTMTDGRNVAAYIAKLIGNPKSYGKVIQIASGESVLWKDICDIYSNAIQRETGIVPAIEYKGDIRKIQKITRRTDQFQYDRMYNRTFDCRLLEEIVCEPLTFTPVKEGLYRAIQIFLKNPQTWKKISWLYEGYMDKVTKERTPLKQIPEIRSKAKYFLGHIIPDME